MKDLFASFAAGEIARRVGLTYADVGSRGGFQSDLHPLAFAVDVVGFEPDPIEFNRLQSQPAAPWKSVTFLPHGVSGHSGPRILHIPVDPQSASILEHDPRFGEKFNKPQFFEIERKVEIDTLNLDDALADAGCKAVDYIKIDIEGAELEVLSASDCLMNDALAIKTEVAFMPFRKNQPLATDIDIFLRQAGFELMEIVQPSHWRRHGNTIHPFLATDNPPYSKGQIVHCDFLYFRDPDKLQDDVQKLLKLALIALSFGYFDHALSILERPGIAAYLKTEFGRTPMEIVSPVSKAYGRKAFIHAFYLQGRRLLSFVRNLKNLLP